MSGRAVSDTEFIRTVRVVVTIETNQGSRYEMDRENFESLGIIGETIDAWVRKVVPA